MTNPSRDSARRASSAEGSFDATTTNDGGSTASSTARSTSARPASEVNT